MYDPRRVEFRLRSDQPEFYLPFPDLSYIAEQLIILFFIYFRWAARKENSEGRAPPKWCFDKTFLQSFDK